MRPPPCEQMGECWWWQVGKEPIQHKSHKQKTASHVFGPVEEEELEICASFQCGCVSVDASISEKSD